MEAKILSRSAEKRAERNQTIVKMYLDLKKNGVANTVCYNEIAERIGICFVTVINVLKKNKLI